jgi:hypothetical protein
MRGQDVNGRIISKYISGIDFRDATLKELVADEAQWLAFTVTVMNLLVP